HFRTVSSQHGGELRCINNHEPSHAHGANGKRPSHRKPESLRMDTRQSDFTYLLVSGDAPGSYKLRTSARRVRGKTRVDSTGQLRSK
ncbi:MAG: hypothetical protein KDI37_07145, partial [Xanthomonadales bacterium]|nr:hypothetical protein [Xanthomonadales bacterium]